MSTVFDLFTRFFVTSQSCNDSRGFFFISSSPQDIYHKVSVRTLSEFEAGG